MGRNMSQRVNENGQDDLTIARRLADAPEADGPRIFESLRATRQLSTAVHQLNLLLEVPEHRPLAATALRRLGFDGIR